MIVLEKDKYDNFIKGLKDGEYELTIKRARKLRSLDQNSFWHGVWLPLIAESVGYLDTEEVCRPLRGKFLGYEEKTAFGETTKEPISTAGLSEGAMKEFLDKVKMFCETELNIVLPDAKKVETQS